MCGANVFIREPWKGAAKSGGGVSRGENLCCTLPKGSHLSQDGRLRATDVIFRRTGPL